MGRDGVDVGRQGQGHHIRLQAIYDSPRLRARAPMGGPDRDLFTSALAPDLPESRIDRFVELAGGVIRNIEERHIGPGCGRQGDETRKCCGGEAGEAAREHGLLRSIPIILTGLVGKSSGRRNVL